MITTKPGPSAKWNRWRFSNYARENDDLYLLRVGRFRGTLQLAAVIWAGGGLGSIVFWMMGSRSSVGGPIAFAAGVGVAVGVAVAAVGVMALRRFGAPLWKSTWKDTGRRATVCDPRYHEWHIFRVYIIRHGNQCHEIAIGEFSNSFWGVYLPSNRYARAAARKCGRRARKRDSSSMPGKLRVASSGHDPEVDGWKRAASREGASSRKRTPPPRG